jgi:hypothetical protein
VGPGWTWRAGACFPALDIYLAQLAVAFLSGESRVATPVRSLAYWHRHQHFFFFLAQNELQAAIRGPDGAQTGAQAAYDPWGGGHTARPQGRGLCGAIVCGGGSARCLPPRQGLQITEAAAMCHSRWDPPERPLAVPGNTIDGRGRPEVLGVGQSLACYSASCPLSPCPIFFMVAPMSLWAQNWCVLELQAARSPPPPCPKDGAWAVGDPWRAVCTEMSTWLVCLRFPTITKAAG